MTWSDLYLAVRDGRTIWVPAAAGGMLNALAVFHGTPRRRTLLANLIAATGMANGSLVFVLHAASQLQLDEKDIFTRVCEETAKNSRPGAPAEYVPRADPEYRCHVNAHEAEEKGPHSIWHLLMSHMQR